LITGVADTTHPAREMTAGPLRVHNGLGGRAVRTADRARFVLPSTARDAAEGSDGTSFDHVIDPRPGPSRTADVMIDPLAGPNGEFLRTLASVMGIRLFVWVPFDDVARATWIGSDTADEAQVETTLALGRRLLEAARAGTTSEPTTDDTATALVTDPAALPLGVMLAVKRHDEKWREEEHEILRFGTAYYGPDLDPRATHPPHGPSYRPWVDGPDIEDHMREALERAELHLVFQPEVDLATSEIVAVEALVRWNHPLYGTLSPDSFIAVAERSSLITVLGSWVISESIRQYARWIARIPALDIVLRINVSPLQMTDNSLVEVFTTALAEHGVPAGRVCIEVTESAPTHESATIAETIRRLKSIGVQSAIDDLATGYSTLSKLRALPVDVIKLDRSLVAGIDTDLRAEAIVGAMIGLAHDLGITVVAEGVERGEEAAMLLRLGCTHAQGHWFGRPVPSRPSPTGSILGELKTRGRRETAPE
jgi:EAL domain-containing protein (putative c-di-GMP-specific phosphodiesterase class I)